jgi:hypothetical protein
MKNIDCAFHFPKDGKAPFGFQKSDCHMTFDIKMTLERKARYVAAGHQTEPTKDIIFVSVVSRDTIRIAFLVAALNNLEVLSADIRGAYLNANAAEKGLYHSWKGIRCRQGGPSCGYHSGSLWPPKFWEGVRDHMAATLRDNGDTSYCADPDVWMRPTTKANGFQYWSYILVYTNDILVVDLKPQKLLDYLASRYTLKPGSVKEPDTYLGAQVSKFLIDDGAPDPKTP